MAEDANARIRVDIDTAAALANIKNLQRQISTFHASLAKSGAAANASSLQLQQSLLNGINRTGQFSASIRNVRTTTESFTNSLEKNKLSMREYFRYSAASTKTFGSLFRSEFDTINKVARERVKDLQTQYIKMGRDANGAMKAIAVRPLSLDMKNLGTQTQIAAQRQALLNQLLKQGSTNLLNFGKNTQWAGRQLMVGFTVPLVMFGAVASKTFMDLEKQAIRFKRVYGEVFTTAEESDKALQDIKDLAKEFTKYGVAAAKTMELAADAAAMGKMGADLTAQVAEATRLAVLGGVEQQEALKTTISLTSAFGVATEDLAKKTDFLNAVENQTVVSIEDLTIAIPKAGPVVKQLGGDVEDLTFFLTAMKEGGINASEGANALKSGLASLINPAEKSAKFLQGLGININAIVEGNAGDIKGTVIDFANALDTLDPLNRARAIEQLFGKFQFSRLSTLFQNVVKEGTQASRVLELSRATSEELAILSERELKRVEDSPMFKFQKALEDIKVSLAPVGEAFLKAVTPLLEFGTKVLEKFNELDEGGKSFVVGLTAIAGVIGPIFLMGFGLIANGVANVIKMFTFFKTSLNKAGTASQVLGMQTDYMTQQQLEASAVAASLNQVHQTLRQTFTSEAAAVNALTAAYERGIIKQQAFMGTAAGRGRAAKRNPNVPGYEKGILIVPGPRGAGDVVPAMLSPGEAIIPANKADKYRALIRGIIAGNIPGFNEGIDEVPGSRKRTSGSGLGSGTFGDGVERWTFDSARPGGFKRGTPESDRWIAKNLGLTPTGEPLPKKPERMPAPKPPQPSRSSQYIPSPFDAYDKQVAAEKAAPKTAPVAAAAPKQQNVAADVPKPRVVPPKPGTALTYTSATQYLPSGLNVALDTPQGADIKGVQSFMKNKGAASSAPMVVEIADRLAAQAKGTTKSQLAPEVEKMLKDPKMDKQFQSFGKEYSRVMNEQLAQAQAKGLTNIKQKDFEKMAKTASLEAAKKSGISQKIVRAVLTDKTSVKETKGGRRKSMFDRGRTFYENRAPLAQRQAARMSPSGTFDTTGLDKAHITPNERMTPAQLRAEAKRQGLNLGAAPIREIAKIEEAEKATSKATAATQKQEKTQRQAARTTDKATKATENKTKADSKSTKTTKTKTTTEAKNIKAQQEAERAAKRSAAALKGVETRRANAAAKASAATTGAPGTKPARPMMGGGVVGMAATGAVMAGSMMPGDIGKMSQDLMMPVMMASMILPMLKLPVAALVVGLGVLVAGAIAVKGAFDKAQDEALNLAESMSGGSKSIKALSEFSGKVSAGEIMDKRREAALTPFSVQTGKTTFGQSFVQSETGKGMVSATRESISKVGSQATQGQLVNQLVTAVSSGALDAMQARSIAANIAQEIGDYSFGINVNAKLLQLLGPNGENLLNNPLEVRVNLVQDTRKQVEALRNPDAVNRNTADLTRSTTMAVAGSALAVAGTLAAFGVIAQAVPVVGTVAGGIALAAAGAVALGAGIVGAVDAAKKLGTTSGANVAIGMLALEQQQEMLDSLDLQYESRIANAKAAGDIEEAERLTTKHIEDREALLVENAKTTAAVLKTYTDLGVGSAGQAAMGEAVDKAIKRKYKDDPIQQALALSAKDQIVAASGLDQTQEYQMKLLVATGDLDPLVATQLISSFGEDKQQMTKVLNVMTNLGSADGNRAIQVMNLFQDKDGKPLLEQQTKFMAKIEAKAPKEARKLLDFYQQIAQAGSVLDTSITLQFLEKNPGVAKDLQEKFDKIKNLDGEINVKVLTEILGAAELAAINDDLAFFNTLSDAEKKVYTQVLVQTISTVSPDDPALKNWLGAEGSNWKNSPPGVQLREYAQWNAQQVVAGGIADTSEGAGEVKPSSSGGGRKADPLDNILKALQNVRKASINAQGGVKELFKLFEKGKNISVFKGIENQLLKLTSNTDFATFIAGLDKKEQGLFITIKKGNVELTKRGRLLEKAYRAKALGDFVLSQQKLVIASKNELTARRLLIKAGYSYVKAVELSRDADIAAAYASAAATKGAKARKKAIEDVDKALRRGLAAQKATLTAEENFNNLYDDIQSKLDADKTAIELKFKVDSAADDKIIRDAENKIAGIQYKLDDQEAGLSLISDKEDVINEKYDKRLEALEKIKSINDNIAQQQKNQISLADALSSGDIGAAALAMQQIQQDFVGASSAKQEDLVEKARQQELLNITTLINGELRTREQIEKTIKDLQKEIFDIEESKLEPALERNRILIVARDEALLKLDQESDKWLAVKNSIEIAKYAALDYAQALRDANALALQAIAQINNPAAAGTEPSSPAEDDSKNDKKPKSTPAPASTFDPPPDPIPDPIPDPKNNKQPDYSKYSLAELRVATNGQSKDQAAAASRELAKRAGLSGGTTADNAERKINNLLSTIPKQTSQFSKAEVERQERADAKIKADAKAADAAKAKLAQARADAAREAAMAARAPKPPKLSGPALRTALRAGGGMIPRFASGGNVGYYPMGGLIPYKANGGLFQSVNTDSVAAMLTPGEFVIKRSAVEKFGADNLKSINNGTYDQGSVYNYSVNVNVATNADSNAIARTVIAQIKQVDSQRIRGVRVQ
jgi:TP901 family phage tail tape measure protein